MMLKFRDFAQNFVFLVCAFLSNGQFISLVMLLKHVLEI